jgi:hypothetical protein
MIPTLYKELATLPRNTNDKVDRKALDALFGSSGISTSSADQQTPGAARSSATAEHHNRVGRALRNILAFFALPRPGNVGLPNPNRQPER